jgi:Membrane bound O-acyl transferase family
MTLMAAVSSLLFANKLIVDDRVPLLLFENVAGYRIGILPPQAAFHAQIVMLILAQIVASNLLAVITWYGVVRPVKENKGRPPPVTALLVTFGCVIPASLLLPVYAMNAIDLRSKTLRFGCILLPMLIPLKCLDALFGVDSDHRRLRTKSLQHYLYYMGFILLPKYARKDSEDGQPECERPKSGKRRVVVPLTTTSVWRSQVGFLRWFIMTVAVYQVLLPCNFRPFSKRSVDRDPTSDLYPTFDVACLYNTFVQAVVLFLTLIFSMYGVAAICSVTANMQVCDSIFDKQPLFCATSPSDFWGRRWNSLVHHVLKEGMYKPVRAATGSPAAATLATFCYSGLLHEYVWYLLFFETHQERAEGDACQTCYHPAFGKHLIFFGWNAVLLLLEASSLGRVCGATLQQNLPAAIVSHLVVLAALPVGHLFTEDLLQSGYFTQLQLSFPMLSIEKV